MYIPFQLKNYEKCSTGKIFLIRKIKSFFNPLYVVFSWTSQNVCSYRYIILNMKQTLKSSEQTDGKRLKVLETLVSVQGKHSGDFSTTGLPTMLVNICHHYLVSCFKIYLTCNPKQVKGYTV